MVQKTQRSRLSAGSSLFQLCQASVALLGAHVPYAAADPLVEIEALIRQKPQRAGLQVTDRKSLALIARCHRLAHQCT